MSRFLRRAALAAALAVALPGAAKLWEISGRLPHPPPPKASAAATTRGHLALVRAHPGLRDLNAALITRDAFFLDAAHALAAIALRVPTMTSQLLRAFDCPSENQSTDDMYDAVACRLHLALLHARDGCFDQVLADVVRLVGDNLDDPRPRVAAAALCYLHGRPGTTMEWLKTIPKDANIAWRFECGIVLAMPGSLPLSTQGVDDGKVMCLATRFAEALFFLNFESGELSIPDKLAISFLFSVLRRFVYKYRHSPCKPVTRSTSTLPPPPAHSGGRPIKTVNFMLLVECSQAILASLLRARPLCGERLREARSIAEHALLNSEAEGDDPAAVDANLLLALLAAREGDFHQALRRYKAAVLRDPSDSRPYELAATLFFITGRTAESDAWRREGKRHGRARATNPHAAPAELPSLLDKLVVAAALGSGVLTALGLPGQRRLVVLAAWREVDARLAAALLDKDLSFTKRLQLTMIRCILYDELQPLQDTANHGGLKKTATDH